MTGVSGSIIGNPIEGVTVRVGVDGGWNEISVSDSGGKWQMVLSNVDEPARPGRWYAVVVKVETGAQLSQKVYFNTDGNCQGGVQTWVVDFRRN